MSKLNNPDGSHSKHSFASKWLDKFYPALSKMLSEERIICLEIGDNYYTFKDPERLDGKEVTIKVTFTEK